jgi:hypothetical protein
MGCSWKHVWSLDASFENHNASQTNKLKLFTSRRTSMVTSWRSNEDKFSAPVYSVPGLCCYMPRSNHLTAQA